MNTVPSPEVGGLVARRSRTDREVDPFGFLPHGPTHRIESVIADRTVTKCGREMRETTGGGLRLVWWPQGVRELPTCRGGCS